MKRAALALIFAPLLIASACASPQGRSRTIDISMHDTAFEPAIIRVRANETVRFRFSNKGKVRHEAFIGDRQMQHAHENEMREMEGEHGHDSQMEGTSVEPGDEGTLTHRFDGGGTLEIGCHEAGHYAAGMKVRVTVGG